MNTFEVRMYYEDTDHGGVVYHANYLKFMERARTEFLRNLGFEQRILAAQADVLFALTRSDVRYLSPAFFDDYLTVETCLVQAKGARMCFQQRILRPNPDTSPSLLVEADIYLACMRQSGKARRIPSFVLENMVIEELT